MPQPHIPLTAACCAFAHRTETSPHEDRLDDLEVIVSEPPPALGAPAGVSEPLFMVSDGAVADGATRAPRSTKPAAFSIHRTTRTLSVDILEELCEVLSQRSQANAEWKPVARGDGTVIRQ